MSSIFAPLTVLMIYSWFIRCQNVCWELRGSRVGLLTAEKQCQSRSQTTGEQLRSQARLIDILTYCTFPGRGLPCGNTLLPYSPPPPSSRLWSSQCEADRSWSWTAVNMTRRRRQESRTVRGSFCEWAYGGWSRGANLINTFVHWISSRK